MKIAFCFLSLSLFVPLEAYAVNSPHWYEFSQGKFVDTANVKVDGDVASGYVMFVTGKKKVITLYEVDCKGDQIRVHSDTPRFVRVPISGGGSVVQSDDGFRTVVPDTPNARIENAICGIVAQADAQKSQQEQEAECQRAKSDDYLRILLAGNKLNFNESLCLSALTRNERAAECDKAGVPKDTTVVQYLHSKGIYLNCEDHPEQSSDK